MSKDPKTKEWIWDISAAKSTTWQGYEEVKESGTTVSSRGTSTTTIEAPQASCCPYSEGNPGRLDENNGPQVYRKTKEVDSCPEGARTLYSIDVSVIYWIPQWPSLMVFTYHKTKHSKKIWQQFSVTGIQNFYIWGFRDTDDTCDKYSIICFYRGFNWFNWISQSVCSASHVISTGW